MLVPFAADVIEAIDVPARRIAIRERLPVTLEIDVFTLFPRLLRLAARVPPGAKRASRRARCELRTFDLRDHAPGEHRQVDDAPYGGGAGMVIRVDVVCAALEATYGARIERVLEAAAGGGADAGGPGADRRRRHRAGRGSSG